MDEKNEYNIDGVKITREKNINLFLEACKTGDINMIKQLIYIVNTEWYRIKCMFEILCKEGHNEIIKYIIDNLSEEYNEYKNLAAYKFTCMNIREIFSTSLKCAGNVSCIEIIQYIIDIQQKHNIQNMIDIQNIFIDACGNGQLDVIKYLLRYENINIHINNEKAFITACHGGNIDIVKYLINYCEKYDEKINIHADYDKAFFLCCINNRIDVIEYLLKYCEKNNSIIDIKNREIFSYTCASGSLSIIKLLLEYGERIGNKIDIHHNYDNALLYACERNRIEIILFLLNYDTISNNMITILEEGCKYFSVDTITQIFKFCEKHTIMLNINKMFYYVYLKNNIDTLYYIGSYIKNKGIKMCREYEYINIFNHIHEINFIHEINNLNMIEYLLIFWEEHNNKIDINVDISTILYGYKCFVKISILKLITQLGKHNYKRFIQYNNLLNIECLTHQILKVCNIAIYKNIIYENTNNCIVQNNNICITNDKNIKLYNVLNTNYLLLV